MCFFSDSTITVAPEHHCDSSVRRTGRGGDMRAALLLTIEVVCVADQAAAATGLKLIVLGITTPQSAESVSWAARASTSGSPAPRARRRP